MEQQIEVSSRSVWGNSQRKSTDYEAGEKPKPLTAPGRLVAITATGPVYRNDADLAVVPVSVGLAFIQELAARAINREARVSSSLANRVRGDTAMVAWANACGLSSAGLVGASSRARLVFLKQVLTYVRREENANGIEPILGAAVNAAWPWLTPTTVARVLAIASKYLKGSDFAATNAIPILDPNNRTFTLFAPGALAKIDPDEWLDWRVIDRSGLGPRGGSGTGGTGRGTSDRERLLGPRGPNVGNLPGPDGRPGDDLGGDPFGGLVGDLLGPRGPKLGDLQGPDGSPRGSDRRDDELNRSAEELLGSRGPSLAGLEGPDGRPRGDRGGSGLEGLVGGLLGPRGPDLGNLAGNGGPYGFGAGLAPGGMGAAGWGDFVKGAGGALKLVGGITATVGAGFILTGAAQDATIVLAVTGTGTMITGAEVLAAGVVVGLIGVALENAGDKLIRDENKESKPTEPKPVEPKPDERKPSEPKHTDLYPDPDGTGGGNPTRLPDFDGGGGNPTTLWDENGGGGNPTTLWDENGGGGNPTSTTTAKFVTVTALTGRGLLAGVVQVGPATFAF